MDLSFFGLTPDSYWKHCVTVLSFADALASQKRQAFGDDFGTAALLHDFGKLLLGKYITKDHVTQMQVLYQELPTVEKEMRVLGVNHAEVGSVVAQSWKLSHDLCRAIQLHHDPIECDTPLCYGLNLANHLAWRADNRDDDYGRESLTRIASMKALDIDAEQFESIFEEGMARLDETLEVYN